VKLTDPTNLATTYVYDGFGEPWKEINPNRGTTKFGYTPSGLNKLLFPMIMLVLASDVVSSEQLRLTGMYSSLAYNSEGGDLVGYEIRIVPTNQGNKAVVQVAEGDAGRIYVVDVTGDDKDLYFDIPLASGVRGKFHGHVGDEGLEGAISFPGQLVENVTIRKSTSYWEK